MIRIGKAAFALVLVSSLAMPTLAASTNPTTPDATNADENAVNGQSPTKSPKAETDQTDNPADMKMSEKLSSDLAQSGFTEIKIIPESFLVRAKDPQGNPVTMMIHPYQVTRLTEEIQDTSADSNANRGGANNSAGATSGTSSSGGSHPATPAGNPKP
jgi:hypothetical protein